MIYCIELREVDLSYIEKINLVFANDDYAEAFKGEIKDIHLECDPMLSTDGNSIFRKAKRGYIRLNLDDRNKAERDVDLEGKKRPHAKHIVSRMLEGCDLVWVEVCDKDENAEPVAIPFTETLDANGMRTGLKVCSSAKIDSDGSLLIQVGETSEFKPA